MTHGYYFYILEKGTMTGFSFHAVILSQEEHCIYKQDLVCEGYLLKIYIDLLTKLYVVSENVSLKTRRAKKNEFGDEVCKIFQ